MSSPGKSLLLWCTDSDFDVDDEVTSTFQVPFLAWDLHAMASQLQKLSLSQRLLIDKKHIEEGLFDESAEIMCGDSSGLRDINSPRVPSKDVKAGESPVKHGNVAQDVGGHLAAPEGANTSDSQVPLAGGAKWSVPRARQDGVDAARGGSVQSAYTQRQSGLVSKVSTLHEAPTAEMELDKLLDSLDLVQPRRSSPVATGPTPSDPVIGSSSVTSLPQSGSVGWSGCSGSSSPKVQKLENQSCLPTRHAATALFIDDTIDDLLDQTAGASNDKQGSSPDLEGEGTSATSISQALEDLDLLLDGF